MSVTSLSLLQKGQSSALVVLFFPSAIGALGEKIRKALGPQPTIVIDQTAKGTEDLEKIAQFAVTSTGMDSFWLACLGGFSAGCQRVRTLCIAGAQAKSYLFIDGAHASFPPQDWQLNYLKELAERAKSEETGLVITHTYIVTEPQFTSTAEVARLVTGWPLPMIPPYLISNSGRLTVYSVASQPLDVKAHSAQAMFWLPAVLDRHVRYLIEPGYQPGGLPPNKTTGEAPACRQALKDADAAWPSRKRDSDGIMGDAAHQSKQSDHNTGNAVDITHDPTSCHGDAIASCAVTDGRVKYVIWNRHINSRDGRGWRPYTGDNPHETHVHISIRPEARNETYPWGWNPAQAPQSSPAPTPQGGGASAIPEKIFTESDGWLNLEDDYLPRVVTQENGHAARAALEALAIAARTFVLRAMLDRPALGTPAQPVQNSTLFQTYAAKATAQCIDATRATAGIVATYSHQLITANYVAGALWNESGVPGNDPTDTEKWITYNKGKTGTFVHPTKLASVERWENRGCMSLNGSDWLARHGEGHLAILQYFYGLDLELVDLRGALPVPVPSGPGHKPAPGPGTPEPTETAELASSDDGTGLLAFAGVGLGWMLQR